MWDFSAEILVNDVEIELTSSISTKIYIQTISAIDTFHYTEKFIPSVDRSLLLVNISARYKLKVQFLDTVDANSGERI